MIGSWEQNPLNAAVGIITHNSKHEAAKWTSSKDGGIAYIFHINSSVKGSEDSMCLYPVTNGMHEGLLQRRVGREREPAGSR